MTEGRWEESEPSAYRVECSELSLDDDMLVSCFCCVMTVDYVAQYT